MNVTIIGTGYVGLVTGVAIASSGHRVICVGRNKEKVNEINRGKPPFYEPDLARILQKVTRNHMLRSSIDIKTSINESDVIIIAVGTPTIHGKIDLVSLQDVSQEIGKALADAKGYRVVVVKSTVTPGTTEHVVKPILERYSRKKAGSFGLCMSPEFLREGSALADALHPDRVIIGQHDERSGKMYAALYKNYKCPIVFTNLPTAEMTKYVSNSLLSTLISYSNEIALLAEKTPGVDVVDVWKGIHLDGRLSPFIAGKRIKPGIVNYLFSGCGYGGSCFPKDTNALLHYAKTIHTKTPILESVIKTNNQQPLRLVKFLQEVLGPLKNKRIAILGLTFKPDTDDIRETPALPIIQELTRLGSRVICHDPQAYQKGIPDSFRGLPIKFVKRYEDAVRKADALLLVTAWNEYKKIKPQFLKKYMKRPVVVDGRRIFNRQTFLTAGITYKGIGLG